MAENAVVFNGTSSTRPILVVHLTYSSYNQAGNYTNWYWWVRYDQNMASSWQTTPASNWSMYGFATTSGSWSIPSAWSGTTTIYYLGGPAYFTKGHNAQGYLAAGTMSVYAAVNNGTLVTDASVGVSSGIPPRIPKAPSTPPAPVFVSAESNSLTFSLTPPSDAGGSPITAYTVQVSTASGTPLTTWSSNSLSQTTPPSLELDPSTQYQVRYYATNEIGNSGWSPHTVMTTESGFYVSDGAVWIGSRVLVSDGSEWVSQDLLISDGASWVLPAD